MSRVIDADLRAELIQMFARDQEAARALLNATKDPPGARESLVIEWPAEERPVEYSALAQLAGPARLPPGGDHRRARLARCGPGWR